MATNSAVITVEGVLQKVVSYAPIIQGKLLYNGLANVCNIHLVTDTRDEKVLERWLELENLTRHGVIIYSDEILDSKTSPDRRLSQVNILRSRGFSIDFVVDPDPAISAKLIANGINVLNFLHSSYAMPQWRPDYEEKVKPWDELEEETTNLSLLKLRDQRMKEESD